MSCLAIPTILGVGQTSIMPLPLQIITTHVHSILQIHINYNIVLLYMLGQNFKMILTLINIYTWQNLKLPEV